MAATVTTKKIERLLAEIDEIRDAISEAIGDISVPINIGLDLENNHPLYPAYALGVLHERAEVFVTELKQHRSRLDVVAASLREELKT